MGEENQRLIDDGLVDALRDQFAGLIPKEFWDEEDLGQLKLIAEDVAGLARKFAVTGDATRRAHYERRMALSASHAATMAFSRLNVREKSLLRTLERVVGILIRSTIEAFTGGAAAAAGG